MNSQEYTKRLEEILQTAFRIGYEVGAVGGKDPIYEPNNETYKLQQLNNEAIPTYDSKLSRQYFQPNYNPQKAHKNGYRLATRELRAVIGQDNE